MGAASVPNLGALFLPTILADNPGVLPFKRRPTPPAAAHAAPGACLNCGFDLGSQRLNYCPSCGQETNIRPPTVGEFVQQFGGSYIAAEGALWRTLKLLLFKPGAITREYLEGRRRRYVLPLRLYLTISVIVLLLFRTFTVVDLNIDDKTIETKLPRSMNMDLGVGSAGLENGVFYCKDLPPWLCRRLQKRYDIEPKQLVRQMVNINERFVANLGATMFLLLPTFALWLWLVYRNRRLQYTEHLVFALHVHAFWFVMLGVSLIDAEWLTETVMLVVPVYTLLAMRRVYGGRWWPLLLRASMVSMLYAFTLGLAFAFTWIVLAVF